MPTQIKFLAMPLVYTLSQPFRWSTGAHDA